jgi:predicted transcriptional regulator
MTTLSLSEQVAKLMNLLQTLPREKATPELLDRCVGWINDLPENQRPPEIDEALRTAFDLSTDQVEQIVTPSGRSEKNSFEHLVPQGGWLARYIEYTRNTEPPTAFHFFAGAVAVGASLGRNVRFVKGSYSVFPNLSVIIVAPSGKCRKTSACNVGIGFYKKMGGLILADKTTPEALVEAFKDRAKAVGLIYAPELAVFLGKQKYNEGMIPMLTALFDCPDEWASATIMRGEAKLSEVALSFLGASTIDWIQTAIPKDAFGGGFMSRLLFVVQESTPRSFPIPPPLDERMKKDLLSELVFISKMRGDYVLTTEGREWYENWYRTRNVGAGASRQYAGYFERKPDHILRLSMILAAARLEEDLMITKADLSRSNKILTWLEAWLPSTFDEFATSDQDDQARRIVRLLKNSGGQMKHSDLLRKSRLSSWHFKNAVKTLREGNQIMWNGQTHTYVLTPIGWKTS